MFRSLIFLKTKGIAKLSLLSLLATAVMGWSTKVSSMPVSSENQILVKAKLTDRDLTELVQQVHQEINQYRSSLDLAPLTLNAQISRQAQMHSQKMAQGRVKFSHHGFERRVEKLKHKIPYRRISENVAYNQGYSKPATKAVAGWIESEGHRQNIIGNYNLTGIGVAKNQQGEYYFTQIFIGEK